MSEQFFSLVPFPAPQILDITITGNISLQGNVLALHYSLSGDIEQIILPPMSAHPSRKDDLWKVTCFEFFMATQGQPQYWEFNLSPSGDWNVYRMDAYRRVGFREETAVQRLPFEASRALGRFTLDAAVDLSPIIQQDDRLEISITAIVQTHDGDETYWALAHPASQADFHLRESFILALAGKTHPVEQSALDG